MAEPRQGYVRQHVTGRQAHIQRLLLSPQAYGTSLLMLCLDRFPEMLGDADNPPWAAETIRLEVQAEFQVLLPDYNLDKIMAMAATLTTDMFFTELPAFIQICNILAGDTFDPEVFDPATASEMAWAMTEVLLFEPADSDEPFTEEIRRYIGFVLDEEGFATPPDILKLAIFDKPRGDPLGVWSDEPELYQSAYAVQQEKTESVESMLRANLQELVQQLTQLPLENGSTADLIQRWQQGLRQLAG